MYDKSRGRELSGNSSPVLLAELFHHQSKRWEKTSKQHVKKVQRVIATFVGRAINAIHMEDRVRAELLEGIKAKLQEGRTKASVELARLWNDEQQQPITYNRE